MAGAWFCAVGLRFGVVELPPAATVVPVGAGEVLVSVRNSLFDVVGVLFSLTDSLFHAVGLLFSLSDSL